MAIMQEQIDALNNEANRLNAQAASVESRLDALESSTNQSIQNIQARVDSHAANIIAQGNARLASIEGKVDRANTALDGIAQGLKRVMYLVEVEIPKTIARLRRDTQTRLEVHDRLLAMLMKAVCGVRDPHTGQNGPAGRTAAALYEHHRPQPVTASDYEELNLPSIAYDAQQIEALEYDNHGAACITAWSDMDALTAGEYADLDLTATAFDLYGLTVWLYDSAGKNLLV